MMVLRGGRTFRARMSTIAQRESKINQIKKGFDTILKADAKALVRTEDFGIKNDFRDAVELIVGIQRLVQALDNLDLRRLPLQRLSTIGDHISEILKSLEAIKNSNEPAQRDNLISNLETRFNGAIESSGAILFLSFDDTVISGLQGQAKGKLAEIEKLAASQTEQVQSVEELLSKAKALATGSAITEYARIFMDESEAATESANNWFWGTFWAIVVTLGTGVILFFTMNMSAEVPTSALVLRGLSKFVLLSFLVGVVVWCSRVYRAYLHNSVVNKHRANALNVFDAFSRAAGTDLQTKHAVLLQATSAIFSPQSSGFIPDDKDQSTAPQIVEIFKSMAEAK